MIDAYVYKLLSGDATLAAILGATEDDSRIDPRVTFAKTRVIVYKAVPGTFDGFFHRDRIELRLIDENDDVLRAMQERATALLVQRDGEPPRRVVLDGLGTVDVYACKQNGGGELDDEFNTHRLLYFNTIWRAYHGQG